MRDWRRRNPDSGKVQRICAKEGCGQQFMAWPDSHRKNRVNRFCSAACSGTVPGTGRRSNVFKPGHPLARGDGRVLKHRWVLFEAIGGTEHPCNWCGRIVTWTVQVGRGKSDPNDLVVDHIDHDTRNNEIENLAPACQRCNVLRGLVRTWQSETGKTVSDLQL